MRLSEKLVYTIYGLALLALGAVGLNDANFFRSTKPDYSTLPFVTPYETQDPVADKAKILALRLRESEKFPNPIPNKWLKYQIELPPGQSSIEDEPHPQPEALEPLPPEPEVADLEGKLNTVDGSRDARLCSVALKARGDWADFIEEITREAAARWGFDDEGFINGYLGLLYRESSLNMYLESWSKPPADGMPQMKPETQGDLVVELEVLNKHFRKNIKLDHTWQDFQQYAYYQILDGFDNLLSYKVQAGCNFKTALAMHRVGRTKIGKATRDDPEGKFNYKVNFDDILARLSDVDLEKVTVFERDISDHAKYIRKNGFRAFVMREHWDIVNRYDDMAVNAYKGKNYLRAIELWQDIKTVGNPEKIAKAECLTAMAYERLGAKEQALSHYLAATKIEKGKQWPDSAKWLLALKPEKKTDEFMKEKFYAMTKKKS